MSFLRGADVVVFVQWIFHLYLPIALVLFVQRSSLSSIKYRQPEVVAVTGAIFTLYTLSLPPIICFGDDVVSVSSRIFVEWALVMIGMVSYILSQLVIAVKFSITEVLLDPRQATEARVHRVQSLRWLLYPRAQILVWVGANGIVCAPVFHQILVLPVGFTMNDYNASHSPIAKALRIGGVLEIAAMTAISWALTRKISRVVDNFGLRETYLSSATYAAACLVLYMIVSVLTAFDVAEILGDVHLHSMIVMHCAQAVSFFIVTQPLYRSYQNAETHREMRIRRRNLQTDVDELEYKVLYRYLCTQDGYLAFLDFMRMELSTDLLLAWHEVEKYKRGEATTDDIFVKILDPQSEFHVDLPPEVLTSYERHRCAVVSSRLASMNKSWKQKVGALLQPPRPSVVAAHMKTSSIAPVMPSTTSVHFSSVTAPCDHGHRNAMLFHPLSAELLRQIYLKVLPRFEEFGEKSHWVAFRNSEKAMVSLDAVENMVRKTIVPHRPTVTMTPNVEDIPQKTRKLTMPAEEMQ
ncbi:Aste57867_15658 [Aphanomyces stellatus]|uniref:Aste57867_15658 protein n=1 Tax=Aphanomyces stellatus TaxID=120398 RepID=A0A485L3X5_9STRA|nr:hypothetical protein As57867_015602 [Aphanomyces stellatus]VFT92453.1 Aste57867_15658 [Aphanomyces stellatus]